MNALICIGENYRDFMPLNAYAQQVAKDSFGVLHRIIFCTSVKDSAIKNLLESKQCFIALKTEEFEHLLAELKMLGTVELQAYEETLKVRLRDQNIETKIIIADLETLKNTSDSSFFSKTSLLYLYPLNMDAISAQMLLGGIAKDFNVRLNVLNANSALEILSARDGDLFGFESAVKAMFGVQFFLTYNFAKSIIELLESQKLKLTTAESCTGGLIAATLTQQSGASAVFDGGVISYANAIKEAWLEVSGENLTRYGAVSEAVIRDMLNGALKLSGADFALATSGIAGPNGGSISKPVGTVYIGVKYVPKFNEKRIVKTITSQKEEINENEIIERLYFKGNRNFIQEQATLYAYLLFLKIFFKFY